MGRELAKYSSVAGTVLHEQFFVLVFTLNVVLSAPDQNACNHDLGTEAWQVKTYRGRVKVVA